METHHRNSTEGRKLIAAARKADDDANRAFRRVMQGEVATSAAATRLTRKADEAWADVRLNVEYGAELEAGKTEAEIAEIEADDAAYRAEQGAE